MSPHESTDHIDADQERQGLFNALLAMHRRYQTLDPESFATAAVAPSAGEKRALAEALAELYGESSDCPPIGNILRH